MAYLKVQYHCAGNEYENIVPFTENEVLIYDRNARIAPWFMNAEFIQDLVAERHNSRFYDPSKGGYPFLGENIIIRTIKLG